MRWVVENMIAEDIGVFNLINDLRAKSVGLGLPACQEPKRTNQTSSKSNPKRKGSKKGLIWNPGIRIQEGKRRWDL